MAIFPEFKNLGINSLQGQAGLVANIDCTKSLLCCPLPSVISGESTRLWLGDLGRPGHSSFSSSSWSNVVERRYINCSLRLQVKFKVPLPPGISSTTLLPKLIRTKDVKQLQDGNAQPQKPKLTVSLDTGSSSSQNLLQLLCPLLHPEMSQHAGPDLAGHRLLLRHGHVPGGRHGGAEDSRTRCDY